jgi:predicted dehydrogenase
MASPLPIGIIGAGNIFPAYLRTIRRSRAFRVVGVADRDPAAARRRAEEFGVPPATVRQLLDGDARIVLNLTPPLSHYPVGIAVLEAGKHLFNEKPLAATYAEGKAMVRLARRKRLRIGCAPDTFLGAGAQTVRALLDADTIGTVVGGSAHFMNHGPDHWHPNPDFFYRAGAGPLLDVGVYYLTHLVHHLGPVAEACGSARITRRERVIPLGQNAGRKIRVDVPTHIVLTLHFVQGATVTLAASFDVWRHGHPFIELYGAKGTIASPYPNRFGGPVRVAIQDGPWRPEAQKRPYRSNSRGIGLVDMARALAERRAHRCSDELALHVLEVMDRGLEAAQRGRWIRFETRCERPAPLADPLF